ncbi:MAG TPA: P-type conjugative transfer protein TrbL [Thermoanaerobaculia bacterium]|nr:P-type conjugative transfer protein TrbL [Thermoanaerobaculia bacterium]
MSRAAASGGRRRAGLVLAAALALAALAARPALAALGAIIAPLPAGAAFAPGVPAPLAALAEIITLPAAGAAFAQAAPTAGGAPAAQAAQGAPGMAGAAPGGGDQILDGLVREYAGSAADWLQTVIPLAQRTFAILAALELAISGLLWALGREGIDAAFSTLLRKFIVLSFLFSLLHLFPLWVPAISRGFESAGQAASGSAAVNPSQVLDVGVTIASNMLLGLDGAGFLTNPAGNLVGSLAALLVLLAYAAIAAQICLTLIENYIVLTGGALFLGFAGFRGTVPFAENYLLYAFQVGTRIFLLYLLVGVGLGLSRQWVQLTLGTSGQLFPSLTPQLHVLAGALIFCLLVWRIPGAVASRLTQGASFRLQDALR